MEEVVGWEAIPASSVVRKSWDFIPAYMLRIDPAFAVERLRFLSKFDVVSATPQIVIAATDLHRLRNLSFWDSMILQAAITSGCDALYSEDMQDGEIVNGVKIVNPFA